MTSQQDHNTMHEHSTMHDHGHGPLAHIRNFVHEEPFFADYQWHIPASFRHMSVVGIVALVVAALLTHLGIINALGIGVGAALLLHIPIVAVTIAGWFLRRARSGFINCVTTLISWKGDEEILDI